MMNSPIQGSPNRTAATETVEMSAIKISRGSRALARVDLARPSFLYPPRSEFTHWYCRVRRSLRQRQTSGMRDSRLTAVLSIAFEAAID